MYYKELDVYEKLLKLYEGKCGQAEKASGSPDSLRYQILKAEADAIKAELELSAL